MDSSSSAGVPSQVASERELAARARIKELLDADSFIENEPFMADTGLVWGYGSVDGKLVYIYAQYDAVGLIHAKRIAKTYISAIKVGAPIIGLHDSKGVRLEEGLDCLEAFGIVFSAQSEASGVVPQVSVITGDCIGVNAFVPALSNFRFKLNKAGYFFAEANGNTNIFPSADAPKNSAVDFYFDNEQLMFSEVKNLLSYLPSNCLEPAPEAEPMPGGPDIAKGGDIICMIADGGKFIEIKRMIAQDTRVGFARLDGRVVGFVKHGGDLSAEALSKASDFVIFCDAFNIPLINFTDINSFSDTGLDAGFLINGGRLIYAYASARVPKINVITGNSVGSACLLASCGFFAADVSYAWPGSVISPISDDAAREVFGYSIDTSPVNAAVKGYIDDIISPADTRSKLIATLNMLTAKRVSRLTKRHGTIL